MTLLNSIIDSRGLRSDMGKVKNLMHHSADELQQVLNNMVRMYQWQFKSPTPVKPSWLSIYMVRIIGANIPIAIVKEKRNAADAQSFQQLMSESTIVALSGLEKARIPYDRKIAAEITGPLIKKVMFAMQDELKEGPSDTDKNEITEGLGNMVELFQGAMMATIGKEAYSVDVKFRFRKPIRGGMYEVIHHAYKRIMKK